MKKWINRCAAGLICAAILLVLLPACPVNAEAVWPEGPEVSSASAVLIELETGTVLYEKNGDETHYPASITKILTTLLAIENCELDEIVTFSEDAVYKNEGDTSHISRDIGEEMTMEQCLYAVMLASANECAYAVAEHVGEKLGGDYSTFVELMNQRAGELGCVNTHFNNCNGLPDEEHWTCAYDMALIARAAYQNETFRAITGTGSYTIPVTNRHSEETILHNHHNMLYPYSTEDYLYDYCTGGKTGYTNAAKNTLVTYAQKDGMTLVCVVMYADAPNHYADTTKLMEYGFSNFRLYNVQSYTAELWSGDAKDTGLLNENSAFVNLTGGSGILLPKNASASDISFEEKESAKESGVAELTFYYADRAVGSGALEASGAVVEASVFSVADGGTRTVIIKMKYLYYLAGGIAALIVLILLIRLLINAVYRLGRERQLKRLMGDQYSSRTGRRRRRRRRRDRLFK